MICAAVSGLTADEHQSGHDKISQTSNGIRPRVIPGQRMHDNRGNDIDRPFRCCRCREISSDMVQ